ncbi:MAG: hypothetical protein SFW65_04960 [Alphaproteobacteria bacterium]|nr:hypothetical protein [Alphaproteobacteria bacterium]
MRKLLLLSASLVTLAVTAHAEDYKDWDLQFNNTARYDHYTVDGNKAASPYPDYGHQWYDEFDGNASRQFSPYEKMRASFSGLVNGSRYRSRDYDFVPERANLFYENGNGAVPYRVEGGDYFANLSYRTEQQSLKGAQVELQPDSSWFTDQSVVLFSGVSNPSWRRIDDAVDNSTGASWLIKNDTLGRVAFNAVYNYRNGAPPMGRGVILNKAQQVVESIAWNKDNIHWGSERLDIEAELANFNGDTNTPTNNRDQSGQGYYTEINGRSTEVKPLSYRFRFEDYGKDFRPAHALITPDHQGIEGNLGWRFENGMALRGRAHHYADGIHTNTNIQDTELFGATLNGPILGAWAPDVSGRVDVYQQSIEDQLKTVSFQLHSIAAEASKPINESWTGNVLWGFQDRADQTAINRDFDMMQWGAGATYSFNYNEWSGNIHPGLIFRDYTGKIDNQFDVAPSFAMHLANANHSLDFGYNVLFQDRSVTGQTDDRTQNMSLDYRYTRDEHEFGVTGAVFDRAVDIGGGTTATRIGAYYTYHFFKPAGSTENMAANEHRNPVVTGADIGGVTEASPELLATLDPGISKSDAQARVKNAGISGGVTTSNAVVYEANLLPVDLRQRLVLGVNQGKLERSALILDIDNMSNVSQMQEHYARIRDKLIASYGKPSREYDSGVDSVGALPTTSILRRFSEWSTSAGKIRFGLSKGIDGVTRYEVQHTKNFTGATSFWGVKF